jgi:HEAT repeats/PBS lyase HEAT-like repeat
MASADTASLPPLGPEETARLVEFARACKAAARAVLLYPAAHPAIAATLGRIVETTSKRALPQPLHLTVLPDGLLQDDRAPGRPDPSLGELAAILHDHLVGELTINPDGDREAWRNFLLLLGRSSTAIRAEGGIASLWAATGAHNVELREIDYAEVLRERGGKSATWETIISHCVSGATILGEDAVAELLGIAADSGRVVELMAEVERRTAGSVIAKAASLMRMIRGLVSTVSKRGAERVEPMLRNMATALGELSPDLLVGLLSEDAGGGNETRVMDAIVSRMTDRTIAHFVSRDVIANNGTPTDRLAEAFQTLVRNPDDRHRLLNLAHDDAAAAPFGQTEGFEAVWNHVAEKLLTSYSDETFVSEEYARELSGARARAVDVERASDDPPERVSVWVDSVAASALRSLDLSLLLDLLRLEQDDDKWGALMAPVAHNLEDLLLVGDFDSAIELTAVLTGAATGTSSKERRQQAMIAIDMLVAGPMMRHIVTHLLSIDDPSFERVKAMCVSLGEVLVRPLAEALSIEERGRTRERLTAILLAFGAAGRRTIERLKASPNAAVRRTAILLLRQFGGVDALPDLADLLGDSDSTIQREAVRAILGIGTEKAYRVLEEALATGTERSRDSIMLALSMLRDERATPLFAYILRHVDHRRLTSIYVRAIESLGALRDPEGIAPLVEALAKGEWWAPRRSAVLRAASAGALARIGTPEAYSALETAAEGSRRIRAAARPFLENRGRSKRAAP